MVLGFRSPTKGEKSGIVGIKSPHSFQKIISVFS